jgi:hypothetical protein
MAALFMAPRDERVSVLGSGLFTLGERPCRLVTFGFAVCAADDVDADGSLLWLRVDLFALTSATGATWA